MAMSSLRLGFGWCSIVFAKHAQDKVKYSQVNEIKAQENLRFFFNSMKIWF